MALAASLNQDGVGPPNGAADAAGAAEADGGTDWEAVASQSGIAWRPG